MAIVAEGVRGRVYLPPTSVQEAVARSAKPDWRPETPLPDDARNSWTLSYGLANFSDLFTPRQLVALTTFSDLMQEAIAKAHADALAAGMTDDGLGLDAGGCRATAYSEAMGVYMAMAVGKFSDNASSICTWHNVAEHQKIRATFGRQALPMTWDFAEGNPISDSTGNFFRQIELMEASTAD